MPKKDDGGAIRGWSPFHNRLPRGASRLCHIDIIAVLSTGLIVVKNVTLATIAGAYGRVDLSGYPLIVGSTAERGGRPPRTWILAASMSRQSSIVRWWLSVKRSSDIQMWS